MFASASAYCRSELLQESTCELAFLLCPINKGLQVGTWISSTPAWLTSFTPEYSMMILKALKPNIAGGGFVTTLILNVSPMFPTHLAVQGVPLACVLGKNSSFMPAAGPAASTVAGSELSPAKTSRAAASRAIPTATNSGKPPCLSARAPMGATPGRAVSERASDLRPSLLIPLFPS